MATQAAAAMRARGDRAPTTSAAIAASAIGAALSTCRSESQP